MLNEGIRRVIRYSKYVHLYTYVSRDAQEDVYLNEFQEMLKGITRECFVDFDVRRTTAVKTGEYLFSLFPLHRWIHRN